MSSIDIHGAFKAFYSHFSVRLSRSYLQNLRNADHFKRLYDDICDTCMKYSLSVPRLWRLTGAVPVAEWLTAEDFSASCQHNCSMSCNVSRDCNVSHVESS